VGAINPDPGDEIITTPMTDMGTIIGILYQNALPIFADVEAGGYHLDPDSVRAQITPRTKAIIVVHLWGMSAQMDEFLAIGEQHGIAIIEDCAQAYLTTYRGRLAGTMGEMACFSMQQSKHITCGDGGITITNNEEYGIRGKVFMDKGWHRAELGPRKYSMFGPNYRMNELSGAVALAQTRKMKGVIALRRARGDLLTQLLEESPHVVPQRLLDGCKHTYWQYGMRVLEDAPFSADEFAKALSAEGVGCSAHYIGKPIFLCHEAVRDQRLYGDSRYPFDHPNTRPGITYDETTCPVTQRVLDRMVLTQVSQFIGEDDVRDIAAAIRKVSRLLRKKQQ
jgi:dTDP-4-amino-4,6-dideoxygalactose transaminase